MFTRISNTFALAGLMLAGCERKVETKAIERGQEARAAAEGRIPCALAGASDFASVCAVERSRTPEGLILTIRHPDGGFHRLKVTTDGRGVVAADGAVEAKVSVIGKDLIEVAIDQSRYRLPATVSK